MKRILFVANVSKEHILKFHVPTIRRFKEEGWQVDVACAGEDPVPYCDTQYHAAWKRSPFTPATFKGITQLKRILADTHYDIVYCHTPVGGLVARLAAKEARKRGTKLIYFAHGLHFYKGAPLTSWLTFCPIEKWLSKHTDVFFAINREDFEYAKAHFHKDTIKVLTNGVGANFDRLNVPDRAAARERIRTAEGLAADDRVLLYVAELIKNKNQAMLLRMMTQLPDNVKLLLVGPEHDDGATKTAIERMGLADRVHCLGWRSDIGDLMAASDMYVASSLREGFPINLLEAMHCHLPVVAARNRGHETAIRSGENGFMVEPNDDKAMAECVMKVLDDSELYEKLSHIDVSRYECDRIAKELYELIVPYAE